MIFAQSVFAGKILYFQQRITSKSTHFNRDLMGSEYFVVQFKESQQNLNQAELIKADFKIMQYIPDDGYIVKGDVSKIKDSKNIHQIIPYDGHLKVSLDFSPTSVFNSQKVNLVLVQAFQEDDMDQILNEARSYGKLVDHSGRYFAMQIEQSKISNLSDIDGVQWIQPYPQIQLSYLDLGNLEQPADLNVLGECRDLTGWESGTKVMNFEAAWNRGYTGLGQTIGIADTGLDTGNPATLHQDIRHSGLGRIFGLYAENWADPVGHGTHVAGSVFGKGSACNGVLKGGAFDAVVIPEGMWSPMMNNLTVPPKLADLFVAALKEGAKIHTNSWGSPMNPGKYESFASQADEFMWDNPDFLILFAAGNSGVDKDKDGRIDPGSIGTPSTAKNVLTVGASENLLSKGGIQKKLGELRDGNEKWGAEPLKSDTLSNNSNGIAAFSSRGPTLDGRLKPDVVAPGTNILSVRSHETGAEDMWGRFNDDYVFSGGTSMATPLVAGAAAVARQYLLQSKKLSSPPSAALIKGLLIHSSTELFPGQYGNRSAGQEILSQRPNNDEGYGRINMDSVTNLTKAKFVDEKSGVSQNEKKSYDVEVTNKNMIVTLVYTDAPAAPNSSKALVNDLDLMIVSKNGEVWGLNDRVNNVEMLELKNIPNGIYTVQVLGNSIPQGKEGHQPFALIISQ